MRDQLGGRKWQRRIRGLAESVATARRRTTAAWILGAIVASTVVTASSPNQSPFVHICGTQLCAYGKAFTIHGATAYDQYDNASAEIALAKHANLNVLEIVEYETVHHSLPDATSPATWIRVDRFIAAARANGLRVILNFSSYGQSLQKAGLKPTTFDWGPFLAFVTKRINTVTGVRYLDDPTIAMYEIYGEIDAPNYSAPYRGTTAETTQFFHRTLGELEALDRNHLASAGGMSYINDPHSGIDWRAIMRDPRDDICAAEINSIPDRNISVPEVSSYCRGLAKPWFLSAWSSCEATRTGPDDINDWPGGDFDRARHAADMYAVAASNHPEPPAPATPSVGSDFWNLADSGSCAIGPSDPLTLAVVQRSGTRPGD